MKIINLFPVPIALVELTEHPHIEKELTKNCLEIKKNKEKGGHNWGSEVFNTCGTYNVFNDKNFNKVNTFLLEKVKEFSKTIGYKNKIKDITGWINIYSKHDYQEIHSHQGSDISAIYYIKTPLKSGRVYFLTHEITDEGKQEFDKDNFYTWKRFYMDPKPGQLLIFKSNLFHAVTQNKANDSKISLAYNIDL